MPPRKKIAIISVLKPVDDARNYKKIGKTLVENEIYDIWIIGFHSSNLSEHSHVHFLPIRKFKRISFFRLIVPWIVLVKLLKVKPDLIIVNTHELLIVTILNQIIFGVKTIYDIQENYYKNILYAKSFPSVIKHFLALYVRTKEKLTSRLINGFILSDHCYQDELNFIHNPFQLIENKSFIDVSEVSKKKISTKLTIVYSGTIAEEYGIFDAISYCGLLKDQMPQLQLVIIGYCPNAKTYRKLNAIIQNQPFIKFIGGDILVPHNEVIKEIKKADFCILPYRTDAYYSRRIPTKIYDCLCLKTPMIVRRNDNWKHLFEEYDAFIFSDFEKADHATINQLQRGGFYLKGDLDKAKWNSEKHKLTHFVDTILSN